MKLSKIKFFSFLALGYSLIACGQAQALTVPNVMPSVTPNAIAQTSTATNTSISEAKVKNGTVCEQVVTNVKEVLETIPDVKVTNNSRFSGLSVPYPDRSANLNRRYTVTISGSGVADFWESGKEVRNEIAKQIIQNCEGVAAVTFGRDRTGEATTIGLFPDGSIKEFTCGADFDRRTRTRSPLTWGQQVCDL
ncbi:hypothetical protein H6F44_04920 [Pseudanabaena sp. FACHB-1277]|jgi:hypothetical protein|uniref:Uncharacterized protein n=1 Tax=Pseudanabaena cinerea FACHB-1277 TaxID=2949581 RepID=A0A926UQN4_9CYAN|nr:hypothetical protein [Pseudanabaena cinerea]MBD2149471.1 hypothetical protein [Pseudanabaena cinerea FACHB-1277]